MMDSLSREDLEIEITGTKAAIETAEKTISIHRIVLVAFQDKLNLMPKTKKPEEKKEE